MGPAAGFCLFDSLTAENDSRFWTIRRAFNHEDQSLEEPSVCEERGIDDIPRR